MLIRFQPSWLSPRRGRQVHITSPGHGGEVKLLIPVFKLRTTGHIAPVSQAHQLARNSAVVEAGSAEIAVRGDRVALMPLAGMHSYDAVPFSVGPRSRSTKNARASRSTWRLPELATERYGSDTRHGRSNLRGSMASHRSRARLGFGAVRAGAADPWQPDAKPLPWRQKGRTATLSADALGSHRPQRHRLIERGGVGATDILLEATSAGSPSATERAQDSLLR
jgi:hypothetical protein